jgi:hypothetical protein
MRKPVRSNSSRIPRSQTTQVQAPVKGWTTDSPVEAKEGTALILDNWFPEADAVRIRGGHEEYATGMSGEVLSLMPYTSASASKLFAANGTSVFDVSSDGAVGAADITGLSNANFQHIMFATSGGQFLVICNGADDVRQYNGAAWSTPVITGATSSTFINVVSHKKRIWFVPVNSTTLYYLPTESIAGAASAFPVASQLKRGGYIMAAGTWSVDAGDGMDDMFVVMSSEGEILVYQGTDPSSAATWEIVGVYYTGKPIGRRCMFPVGGDLAIITEDGVIPMSGVARTDRAAIGNIAISKQIRQAYADAVSRAGSIEGWQLISHPAKNMAILNIPASGSDGVYQFVFNTLTGAPCRFTGLSASCWALYDGGLYFGGSDGIVYKAESGGSDNGASIVASMLPSYMHLGAKGRLKHVKGVRPIWFTDVPNVLPQISIGTDYQTPTDVDAAQDVSSGYFVWDTSAWDVPDIWYGYVVQRAWRGSGNIGTVISPYTYVSIDAGATGAEWRFRVTAWDILYELGGVI